MTQYAGLVVKTSGTLQRVTIIGELLVSGISPMRIYLYRKQYRPVVNEDRQKEI